MGSEFTEQPLALSWETDMFVVETTGFRPGDAHYYLVGFWLMREGCLKLARWELTGVRI